MKSRFILIYLLLITRMINLSAQVYDMVIAKDGSGDYTSIGNAVGRMPSNSGERFLVFIKNGLYQEKVNLNAQKTNISLIGESTEGVIISWDDYANKVPGMSTASTYTFLAEGNDLYAENITIENSAGPVGQAVAIRTTGERQVFKNCRFIGFQDTYYAHKNRQYNLHCYIEGATDFIFGDATAVFDSCTVVCVSGGQYISAPADTKLTSELPDGTTFLHGLLFRDCQITAGDGVGSNSYYLGRPWQPNASSVYINCTLEDHIRPEGWSVWSGEDNHLSSFFAEYHSVDQEGNLIDTLLRVDWSYQLKDEMVNNYYTLDYFLMKDSVWDPLPMTRALAAPEDLTADVYTLSWSEVINAKGYVIFRNDSAIGFSEINACTDAEADGTINNIYYVKSVSYNGNLSASSNEVLVEQTISPVFVQKGKAVTISMSDHLLRLSEQAGIKIYSMSGRMIREAKNTSTLNLDRIQQGIYLVRIETEEGLILTRKIFIQ